jgi:hypothetical protein
MWWTRIVGALVLLIGISFLAQWLLPRRTTGTTRRKYLRWDIAPIIAFFGALLLALSFAEAARGELIAPWGWGIAFGLLVSLAGWAMLGYRRSRAARPPASAWSLLQRFGTLLLAAVLGLYLSIRVFGTALEVFVAAALGILIVASAVAMFVENKPITEETNVK